MNTRRTHTSRFFEVALSAAVAIAILQSTAAAVDFLAASQYPVGTLPSEAVIADFNNDGHPDVATDNTFDETVSILLNNGDGTFAAATAIPVSGFVKGIVSRDFNGDGKADLVISEDNVVKFMAGNGNGTFQPGVSYQVGADFALKVGAGDFNGDSKMDIVSFVQGGPSGKDGFVVLLGNGNGTFGSPTFTESFSFQTGMVPADLDNDGKLDLVVLAGDELETFRGKGNGGFQLVTSYETLYGEGLAVGDLNADGKPDAVVAEFVGTVDVFLGKGDGSFLGPTDYTAGESWAVTVADLNSDGKADLVTAGLFSSVLLGNGDGTLQEPIYYAASNTNNGGSISVTDVDGDAIADLVACNLGSNSVGVTLGVGGGVFKAPKVLPSAFLGQLVKGDFNADGKTDVASVDGISATKLFLGNGDGTFQAPLVYAVGNNPDSLAATDFNADNKLDLVVANRNSGNVSVLLGRGNGTFNPARGYRVYSSALYVLTGDFNNDGRPDIAAMAGFQTNGKVSVLINRGDGTFNPKVDYTADVGPWAGAVGDFNHDGNNDMVILNQYSSYISIMMGSGDGTFQPTVNILSSVRADTVRTADFNNDGKLDLSMSSAWGLTIMLGNGDATFQEGILTPGPIGRLAVGDFDGDGKRDAASFGLYGLELFLGNGDGTFAIRSYGTDGDNIVAGDFNGDNALDLVLNSGGLVSELNMGGTSMTLTSSANPSHINQPVTFTAMLTFTVPFSPGTPTGQIRFQDGAQLLGTVALSGGQATVTTSTLAVGNHNIRALYTGDANYNPNSALLLQRVRP